MVECVVWDHEVAGSRPVTPTIYNMKFGEYLFSRNEQYEEMMTEGVNNTIVYERPKEEIDKVMRSLWEIAQ